MRILILCLALSLGCTATAERLQVSAVASTCESLLRISPLQEFYVVLFKDSKSLKRILDKGYRGAPLPLHFHREGAMARGASLRKGTARFYVLKLKLENTQITESHEKALPLLEVEFPNGRTLSSAEIQGDSPYQTLNFKPTQILGAEDPSWIFNRSQIPE